MKTLATALALLFAALPCRAETAKGSLRVFGDSTLHKWTTTATVVTANLSLKDDAPAALIDAVKASAVKGLEVRVLVAGLKSGESGLDKNLRKTMMDAKFPEVVYALDSYETSPAASGLDAKTAGRLTIAGKTLPAPMTVHFRPSADGVFVSGEYALNMSDFGIKPPTLMLGAIKVRDPVTIRFDLLLTRPETSAAGADAGSRR